MNMDKKIRTTISIGSLSTTCSMKLSDLIKNIENNKVFFGNEYTEEQEERLMTYAVLDSLSSRSLKSVARKLDIILVASNDYLPWTYKPTEKGCFYPSFDMKVGLKYSDYDKCRA